MLILYYHFDTIELFDNNLNRNVKKVNTIRISLANEIAFRYVDWIV